MAASVAAPSYPAEHNSLKRRVAAVDLLRGLIMIIMALDHTRDFFSNAGVGATDPLKSWPALFFTRWITHLCAPGFVALAGTSIYLQRQRGRSASMTAKRLLTRGVWLIFVELAIVSFGLFFTYHFHFLQVIYAIGGGMIVLAALQFLPTWCVAAYGAAIVLLHNLLDGINANQLGQWSGAWKLLIAPGPFLDHGRLWAMDVYPLLPWSGVMALGYAFGAVVMLPAQQQRRRAMQIGAAALALFAVLRYSNVYGDPSRFQHLGAPTRTVMSFFNVTKYPPSLQYVCVTFGVLLFLYALGHYALENHWLPRALQVIETYGRVPFFYYVLHFYILHLLAVVDVMLVKHTRHITVPTPFAPGPPEALFPLPVVYLIWISVVAFLYLPCRWFAGVKAGRRDWWLSYL